MTPNRRALVVPDLKKMKRDGKPIVALTAYDATFARAMDDAGIDVILVGDSLGMVIQGHGTTLPVTLDHMVYHAAAVARGSRRAIRMVDLPFMSYATPADALASAGRLLREGEAHIVKLEGGDSRLDVVRALTREGVPVAGHLGLLPQSVLRLGGYTVQGRDSASAEALMEDAKHLEEAGAAVLILECIPAGLAERITQSISIPTIGIGAGLGCDGQVLVLTDMLGLSSKCPKFCKDFLEGATSISDALGCYVEAVRTRNFPRPEHAFG
ncbi:MAG: 3-methyl-2-oxobutanoate hydroxymethyltransferase [Pseudomonadota bacterium]|jgi:3-methyl-2-oxobutanoate hydroxymethyltransferase